MSTEKTAAAAKAVIERRRCTCTGEVIDQQSTPQPHLVFCLIIDGAQTLEPTVAAVTSVRPRSFPFHRRPAAVRWSRWEPTLGRRVHSFC